MSATAAPIKPEAYTPKPITYNTNLEKLLKENSEECESLSILHRMSYEKYNRRSNYINIPVIILSSAIGFITGIDLQYDKMNIILGVGSVFVGIIKSVDTYFQLAKRAESHRICSLQFSQISKKMQVELTLHRNQRMSAENMMNIIKTDIKNMQDIAPLIDKDIINIYNAKYRKYKRVKKPNFVNGLTDVVVNTNNNEYEYEYSSRQGSREASPANYQNEQRVPSHDPEYEQQQQLQQQQQSQQQQQASQNSISKLNSSGMFNTSGQPDNDNDSIDPIQPTIIPTAVVNTVENMMGQTIRKSPSLSTIPQIQIQNQQPLESLKILQLLNQLQQQGIGAGLSVPIVPPVQSTTHTPSPAPAPAPVSAPVSASVTHSQSPPLQAAAPSAAPTTDDVIVSIDVAIPAKSVPSVSPAGSIRSNASAQLGVIQTDSSGNQVVNT
jgi:hypothetical protein